MAHSSLRFLFALLAMTAAWSSWAQSIFVGGHKALCDSVNNRWLCSVPQQCFGTDWETTVTLDSLWTAFAINGQPLNSGDAYTFMEVEGGKEYRLEALVGDSAVVGSITFTWLPLLELNGEFGNEYTTGTVSLYTPDSVTDKSDMLAKLKWRGGVTNGDGKHKRNYHIKFIEENGDKKNRRLLGMRKDNHWKLDGGQIDFLRIRNRVCTDLWLDMARDPWYKSLDSTVVNGSRGRVTEVFLNGKYHGIYSLIEPVDRKQLALVKHDTVANVFHGQQWDAKDRCPTYVFPAYNNNSATWNGNEISYPELEDVSPTDWSTLYNAFEFARRMDAADDWQTMTDSLGYYFDLPVMQDYYIFIVSMQAIDNEIKNIYYSCYDKQIDPPLLTLTPWDLDISVGAKSISGLDVKPERPVNWIMHLALGDMFNHCPVLRKQIKRRYWELRETWLNTDSLVNRFQNAVDELENCGAAAREEERWSKDSDLGGKVLDISNEMGYVATWLTRRMAYLDDNVFNIPIILGDANDDDKVNIADVTLLINYLVYPSQVTINEKNSDINGDGEVNIADIIQMISMLLNGYF
jgi:hypothetical protein